MALGKLIYTIRRQSKLGFRHWYAERFLADRINEWRGADCSDNEDVPLHLLTSRNDWKMALWMLASFHEATRKRWLVFLHEDGSLGDIEFRIFRSMFPKIHIVTRRDADLKMEQVLGRYSRCQAYRRAMPHGLKAFDIPYFCQSDRFLMIDPDVLFFRPPGEILNWAEDSKMRGCWFNRDFQEPSPISPAQAVAELGVPLWPSVNTGLCLLERQTVRNLDAMEEWLGHPALQNPKMQWRVEQTLLALCASQDGVGGLLPDEYEVSPHKNRKPDGISRHYIGCVRDRFYSEGILKLHKCLFN
jgi:hypothetical protein